jgi:hypothetical protein
MRLESHEVEAFGSRHHQKFRVLPELSRFAQGGFACDSYDMK